MGQSMIAGFSIVKLAKTTGGSSPTPWWFFGMSLG